MARPIPSNPAPGVNALKNHPHEGTPSCCGWPLQMTMGGSSPRPSARPGLVPNTTQQEYLR